MLFIQLEASSIRLRFFILSDNQHGGWCAHLRRCPVGVVLSDMRRLPKRMVEKDSPLRAYVTEHTQLLLVFCTHIFFFVSLHTRNRRVFW